MAGYFITNNMDVFKKVRREAAAMFRSSETKEILGWNLIIFKKKHIANNQNCYEFDGGFLVGVGTFIYKKRFGYDALKLLVRSLDSLENPFKEVQGHFNFILFRNGRLSIVTDKSGHYAALKAGEEGNICFSTSFILLCQSLGRIKLGRQEALEFVNVAATFGGKTIVQNINHLEAGHIYDLDGQVTKKKYYHLDDRKLGFDDFVDLISAYFNDFKFSGLRMSCDLSAGFDSRAVASVMLHAGIPFTFISNKRPSHAVRDLEIAQHIAALTGVPLHEIELENHGDPFDDPGRLVCATEMTRGLDIARRQLSEIINKSLRANMVVSGWGAEMLRNQHGRLPSLELNARGFGYSRITLPTRSAAAQYHHELRNKFTRDIEEAMGLVKTAIGERIYYLERGRYWSASVLSVRNQYCYWLYPFFDHAIAKYLFDFKNKDERFQKRIIDHFAPQLKDIQLWDAEVVKSATLSGKLVRWAKKMVPLRLMLYKRFLIKKSNQADFSDQSGELNKDLTGWLGFDAAYLLRQKEMRSINKYQALSEFIENFKEKVDFN